MYVCLCKAITEGDIQTLVDTLGPDFVCIQKICGVASDCGSCRRKAEKLIQKAAAGAVQAAAVNFGT